MKTFENSTIHWIYALSVAALQIGVAIFAVYSSNQDRLSDAACIGGGYGSLTNLVILVVVVIWSIILAVKSRSMAKWHDGLRPLSAVAVSSTIATFIGLDAALHCTV